MIKRYYQIDKLLKPGKVIVLYGPRRVGKTTLVNDFLSKTKLRYRLGTGDNVRIRELLASDEVERILKYVEGYELLVIDEAQRIPRVGWGLKIIVDRRPDIRVLVTGSSSLNLAYKVGEPLVGRKFEYHLFPVAQLELRQEISEWDLREHLEDYMVFGSYPEVLEAGGVKEKRKILVEMVESYLLKDLLEIERVKRPQVIVDLLRLLAFQVGSEVSLSELGSSLEIDKKTVVRYLDLLEQAFVIYKVRGFSRNLRKEISKKAKYYFYDNGVRNGLIRNFNELGLRNDVGQLWENWLFMERMKKREYEGIWANVYFWRTHDQQEVDLVEEREGKLYGYEFKWNEKKKVKSPKDWLAAYPEASFEVITKENYLEWVW